jgi:glycosyltransferase involved in cell wall biosynthesis
VRIAFLTNGMTGYLDNEYRHLHKVGNELLVVAPRAPVFEAMADTAFVITAEDYARSLTWSTPPKPAELVAQVVDFAPDAVAMMSWNFTPAYRAVMKAVPRDVVRILIMDNLWRSTPKQWLGRLTHRWYVQPVADVAMVPSQLTEWYARRLGFSASDIIRGSLSADVDLFASPPRTGAELAGHRAFLSAGRLVWHKGADVLAAAYARYRELVTDPWDLHVVGTGPYEEQLRAIPGVVMHGFVQPPQVAELMRRVSCFVLPSHIEPYGVVVHEAAVAGLPVLCTDFAGATAGLMQDSYNGWVVAAGDVGQWADAMARMSALPPERLTSMSDASRLIGARISPSGWAQNVHEQIARRRAANLQRGGR